MHLAEADHLRESSLRVEERLGLAQRADQHPQGLQRRLRPAHETIEVRGGKSSREAIPIGAVEGSRCALSGNRKQRRRTPARAFDNENVSTPLAPYLFPSIYQTNGTNRYRTFRVYSVYPGRFLCRNLSSSRSRHMSAGIKKMSAPSPHHEPSASGVPMSKGSTPAYIGWRTTSVGACRDDRLSLGYLDRGSSITILANDEVH